MENMQKGTIVAVARKIVLWLILKIIRFYQYAVSPHFPPCCRFFPSCSSYAYEAVQKHGIFQGIFMALRRLLRCHPFHPGGYDPVK